MTDWNSKLIILDVNGFKVADYVMDDRITLIFEDRFGQRWSLKPTANFAIKSPFIITPIPPLS